MNEKSSNDLCKLMDAISDPLLSTSDEDTLQEAIEDGEDPVQLDREVKEILMQPLKESGAAMTKQKALGFFLRGCEWLRVQVESGSTCFCGACLLCAYRHLEGLQAREV